MAGSRSRGAGAVVTLALYLGLGAAAGFLAGLFGIGGGMLIVPVLVYSFALQDIPAAVAMHLALGTSLATIIVTAGSSVLAHHRHRAVRWPLVARLAPGVAAGAVLGAVVADFIPGLTLQRAFGVAELALAAYMLGGRAARAHRELPGSGALTSVGLGIGALSALAGIGGGSLTVPFLSWCNVPMRYAVGVAAACGLPIAAAGAGAYAWVGWGNPALPEWSTGYVYWPAFIGISLATLLCAPLGARLAHRLPEHLSRRLFALLLAGLGLAMLIG